MADELGQRDILTVIVKLLDKYRIPYFLTGSFAVSYYGYPRATHDIDFVLEVELNNLKDLEKALKQLDKSFLTDWDQIKMAIERKSQFNILHLDTGIKIDFWPVRQNEFEKGKMKRKRVTMINKQKVFLVSPEDLILTKLLWCREVKSEKHMRDCAGMMKIQKGEIDNIYLTKWAKKILVTDLLDEAFSQNY